MRILFLNGWSVSSAVLGDLPGLLSKNYELIMLDHPYQYSADELHQKLDSMLCNDTVLMGWSLGGMLAIRYLQAKAGSSLKPRALVLLQATPCFMQKADWTFGVSCKDFVSLEKLVDERNAVKMLRYFSQLMLAGSAYQAGERAALKACYTEDRLPDWPILSRGLRALKTLDFRTSLDDLQVPVLGLYGENDVLIKPEIMACMAQQCPQFEGYILPEIGHFPFGRQVHAVANYIDGYLQTLQLKRLSHECD